MGLDVSVVLVGIISIVYKILLATLRKPNGFNICADVKSVNKATIGNDLLLDNYINTAISKVRVLKREYQCRRCNKTATFFKLPSCFFGATEKKWTQTDHKHELFDN